MRTSQYWSGSEGDYVAVNKNYIHIGLTLDMSFSVTEKFSIGPYLNIHTYIDNDFWLGFFGGCMTNIDFDNDFAILAGLGGGYSLLMEDVLIQPRIGIKFPFSLYLVGSFMYDISDNWDYGFSVGIGYSFGGKKR